LISLILAGLADQLSNQLTKATMKFSIALISLISFATIAAATDAVYADHPAARDFNDEFGVVRRDSEGALYRVCPVLNNTAIVRLTIVIYCSASKQAPAFALVPALQVAPNATIAAAKATVDSLAHARWEDEGVNGVMVESLTYRLARIAIMQQYIWLYLYASRHWKHCEFLEAKSFVWGRFMVYRSLSPLRPLLWERLRQFTELKARNFESTSRIMF